MSGFNQVIIKASKASRKWLSNLKAVLTTEDFDKNDPDQAMNTHRCLVHALGHIEYQDEKIAKLKAK